MTEKFYEILENVAIVKGNLTNKTFLPLPMNVEQFSEMVEQIVLGFVNVFFFISFLFRYSDLTLIICILSIDIQNDYMQ